MMKKTVVTINALVGFGLLLSACAQASIDPPTSVAEEAPTEVGATEPPPTETLRPDPTPTAAPEATLTGELVWVFETGAPSGAGLPTSAVVADGVVYFGASDGSFYAVDIVTGEE